MSFVCFRPCEKTGEKTGEKRGEISPLHLKYIFIEFSNKILSKMTYGTHTFSVRTYEVKKRGEKLCAFALVHLNLFLTVKFKYD